MGDNLPSRLPLEVLEADLATWRIVSRQDSFPAPEESRKEFATLIAEKPAQAR